MTTSHRVIWDNEETRIYKSNAEDKVDEKCVFSTRKDASEAVIKFLKGKISEYQQSLEWHEDNLDGPPYINVQ